MVAAGTSEELANIKKLRAVITNLTNFMELSPP
jgi:hypothetical protein